MLSTFTLGGKLIKQKMLPTRFSAQAAETEHFWKMLRDLN
jgi:hypothetical protein